MKPIFAADLAKKLTLAIETEIFEQFIWNPRCYYISKLLKSVHYKLCQNLNDQCYFYLIKKPAELQNCVLHIKTSLFV